MKAGRTSRTATFVTFARALADAGFTHVEGFRDPTARRFLSPRWSRYVEKARSRPRSGRQFEALVRVGDALALRTVTIDDALRTAVANGARQVVILGAGFDGRAFRMPELADVDVFEVDHPDTQSVKRARIEGLEATARSVHFIALDFEKDDLGSTLSASGHRAGEPTVWLWEGVVMYLEDAAFRATLASIAAQSAPGSTLVTMYTTPERRRWFDSVVLWLWKEPQVGLRSPETMRAELQAAGFQVDVDSGMEERAARHAISLPRGGASRAFRVVVARKERAAPDRGA